VSRFALVSQLPLFDRLCGTDLASPPRGKAPAASLERELGRLLHTRNGLTRAQFLACEGSVLHYGLPDLQGLSPQVEADLQQLAQVVGHALALFEPRLKSVHVQARHDPGDPVRARVAVSASGMDGGPRWRVEFPLALDGQDPGTAQAA
jgi:type VI secretion system protein ImpF